jgi:hypothetical protein
MTTTPTLSVALASPQVVVISVLDLVNNDLFFYGCNYLILMVFKHFVVVVVVSEAKRKFIRI